MVNLLVAYMESNATEKPTPAQPQQFVLNNTATPDAQRPSERSRLPEYIHQAKIEKQAKKVFQMKVSKSEKQKYLVARIQCVAVEKNYKTKRRGKDEQLKISALLHVLIICIQICFITFITFLITI